VAVRPTPTAINCGEEFMEVASAAGTAAPMLIDNRANGAHARIGTASDRPSTAGLLYGRGPQHAAQPTREVSGAGSGLARQIPAAVSRRATQMVFTAHMAVEIDRAWEFYGDLKLIFNKRPEGHTPEQVPIPPNSWPG